MQNPKHSVRKHSKFAASSSERWLPCPGSVLLSEKAPPQVESFYAKEGTDAHECLEFIVKRYNSASAKTEALKRWPVEMVDYAMYASTLVYKLRPSPSAKLLTETRVQLKNIGRGLFGTLDYAWVEDWGSLVVIDFKYGQGVTVYPVDDEGKPNSQLMYYASGICQKYGYDFDRVVLAIIQPRVWREDGTDALVTHETNIGAIRDFERQVKTAVTEALKPNAKLCAGDHCRWCPATTICPEVSTNTMASADIVFDFDDGLQAVPEARMLTAADLPRVLVACDKLETWIEAVRKYAFELAEKGERIDGFKLVAKRSTRVWVPTAETAALERFGDTAYETEKRFLSPAQLEKKLGKTAKEFTEAFTTSVSSGFTLVSDKDKRPAVENVLAFDIE